VGLSHVSKDWRITFFSNAARIWSQGLRTEVGEVANAIVQILARAACVLPSLFTSTARTTILPWRKACALRPTADGRPSDRCWSVPENGFGAVDKKPFCGTLENFP
jgi:hypothetical protein